VSKRKPEETPIEEAAEGIADLRVEAIRERAQRQLRAGRLSRLNDRIAGGPRRPGEQEVARSPFVLGMGFVLLGLAIVAAVFLFLNLGEGEKRQLKNASAALKKSSYNEAVTLFKAFLLRYPNGESAETARIGLHTAQVRKYTDDNKFSVESAVSAQKSLEEFIRECRDFDQFKGEQENLVRYAKKDFSSGSDGCR
jgi:TolA-binding protein